MKFFRHFQWARHVWRQEGTRKRRRAVLETIACALLAAIFTAVVFRGVHFGFVAAWWAVFVYALPAIVVIIDEGVVLLRYFGLRTVPLIVHTLPLMERSHRAVIYFVVWIAAVIIVPAVLLFHFPIVLAFLPFAPIHPLVGLAHALQPATVLVLAASSDATLWLQERIASTIVPHRVISLLRLSEEERFQSRNTPADIVRTIDDHRWREVVVGLMRLVPIIVVDVRTQSHAVREELAAIRDLGLESKTVFVIAGGSAQASEGIAAVHDWEISNFLWYVTTYRRVQPARALPLRELQLEYAEDVALSGGHGNEAVEYLEKILDRFAALTRAPKRHEAVLR